MKPDQPEIQYLFPSPGGYVSLDDATSQSPMRMTRRGVPLPGELALNYGQYFQGITDVISQGSYDALVQAASKQMGQDVLLSDVDRILIYAEKHGSDYHPARIEICLHDTVATFVMNVAVTGRGKAWLSREFEVLESLNRKYGAAFLPRTYFQGEALCPPMLMFLADWFQGYDEFHLSVDPESGLQGMMLWDSTRGRYALSERQAREIYRQAATILTMYYDLETFEQIFPWHHAAGDFVARADKQSMDVRLITARQYAPMLDPTGGISAYEALLFFLLNLSLRMRLDRLDGVGPVAWADDGCVDATLEGFVETLRVRERQGVIEAAFVDGFLRHARSLAKEDLSSRFHAIVDACDQAAPDIPVIRAYLQGHISKFHSAFQVLNAS